MNSEESHKGTMISIDPGVNGSAALWKNGNSPILYSWSREGRMNGGLLIHITNLIVSLISSEEVSLIVVERPWAGAMRGGAFQSLLFDDLESVCRKNNIKFKYVAPKSVKARVCGNGNASKKEVMESVKQFFESKNRLLPDAKTEHDYDAIAVGISYMRRRS